eukprot:2673698-Amphidinium_carterae.1
MLGGAIKYCEPLPVNTYLTLDGEQIVKERLLCLPVCGCVAKGEVLRHWTCRVASVCFSL